MSRSNGPGSRTAREGSTLRERAGRGAVKHAPCLRAEVAPGVPAAQRAVTGALDPHGLLDPEEVPA